MKIIRSISKNVLLTVFYACAIYPLIHWANNPELSEMEILIDFKYFYLLAVICAVIYHLIYQKQ